MDFAITLDFKVMLFSAVLSAVTGIVFGLAPALRATKLDVASAMKDNKFGLRNGLVVAQVSLCTVLLICSGLFLRRRRATSIPASSTASYCWWHSTPA
jgi:hypothetical protein